jgi:hypothetical protein
VHIYREAATWVHHSRKATAAGQQQQGQQQQGQQQQGIASSKHDASGTQIS